ncbi:uncharacterized protein VTP21DRAFT_342 [Calcarisporiella thermophila]|uniref:uncharacterized protein n=1 Tax=Calcarisporiella thermophila TaxID=911321 RepID=UPI00374237AB
MSAVFDHRCLFSNQCNLLPKADPSKPIRLHLDACALTALVLPVGLDWRCSTPLLQDLGGSYPRMTSSPRGRGGARAGHSSPAGWLRAPAFEPATTFPITHPKSPAFQFSHDPLGAPQPEKKMRRDGLGQGGGDIP